GGEGLARQDRRRGVVAVVRRLLVEAGDDDVGLEAADRPDHVGERLVVAPERERLVGALGVAEVAHAAEALLGAVEAARRPELLGANDVEELALLAADEVLAAAAARPRQVGGGDV